MSLLNQSIGFRMKVEGHFPVAAQGHTLHIPEKAE